jgi:hypothetical protein
MKPNDKSGQLTVAASELSFMRKKISDLEAENKDLKAKLAAGSPIKTDSGQPMASGPVVVQVKNLAKPKNSRPIPFKHPAQVVGKLSDDQIKKLKE